jgi:hypothetical protein
MRFWGVDVVHKTGKVVLSSLVILRIPRQATCPLYLSPASVGRVDRPLAGHPITQLACFDGSQAGHPIFHLFSFNHSFSQFVIGVHCLS